MFRWEVKQIMSTNRLRKQTTFSVFMRYLRFFQSFYSVWSFTNAHSLNSWRASHRAEFNLSLGWIFVVRYRNPSVPGTFMLSLVLAHVLKPSTEKKKTHHQICAHTYTDLNLPKGANHTLPISLSTHHSWEILFSTSLGRTHATIIGYSNDIRG